MRFLERFWQAFAVITVGLIVIASIVWMRDHAFGIDWDESEYFDRALADMAGFQHGGLLELGTSIFREDIIRPPAYRLLAIPVTLLFGFNPVIARLVSVVFLVISLGFVYLTAKRLGGQVSGAFAVIFLVLCPIIISSSIIFGTEYSLFLATTATLYFLFRNWNAQKESTLNWIGLGGSLGLGALAKTSFALVAGPVLAVTFFMVLRKQISSPSPKFFMKAVAFGFSIALPWWLLNVRSALWYARFSSGLQRHSLGNSPVEILPRWLVLFGQSELGPMLTILALSIIMLLVFGSINKAATIRIDSRQSTALWVCFLGSLPLIFAQLIGKNDNTRYVAPVLILFAIGFGVLVQTTEWKHARLLATGASILFGVQLIMTIYPILNPVIFPSDAGLFETPPWLVMARREQWNWEPFRELAQSKGIVEPSISFLGIGTQWNWPAIIYPWALHKEGIKEINWLWRYENGPINWEKTMSSIDRSDVVLTAPDYVGYLGDKQDLDNQYNQEFAERLRNDPRFVGPIHLTMGRFEPVDIVIFVRAVYAQH